MVLTHAVLLLLLFQVAASQFRRDASLFVDDPASEWDRMGTVIKEGIMQVPEYKLWRSGTSTAKQVPQFVVVSAADVKKEYFKPEKNTRPLPQSVKDMLLGATVAPTSATGGTTSRKPIVEALCHIDRIYIRVRREVFKTRDAYKYLNIGKCPVNQGTKEHYYLLYLLTADCGFNKESNLNEVIIRNSLQYKPVGPVLREMPFDLSVQCKYPRFFHSFKVGFHPKLQGGTVFKALQPKTSFTLTPQDASGNEITGTKTYTLGQLMFFEAKQPDATAKSGNQRIYVKKCFMSASQDSSSNPKYTVIDNHGCMIDSKVAAQSKFLAGPSKMKLRFSLVALIFNNLGSLQPSAQQLYMHCEIAMGQLTPTQDFKACNYDSATKKWKELYGDDSVCTCCDSTCTSMQPKSLKNIISSHSWKVDLSSKDGYAEVIPKMRSTETFSFEDPSMSEHGDVITDWE